MGPLKRWQAGDLITHGRLNKMQARAELAGMIRGAGASTVGVSTTGVRVATRKVVCPVMFRLYSTLTYPANTSQAPFVEANRVYLHPITGIHALSSNPVQETIYYSLAMRDSEGAYIGLPRLQAGMIVYALWDRQSGRREIVAPEPQTAWRGKLDGALARGGSAAVSIWQYSGSDADSDVNVTAHDWFLDTGEELPAGTKVKVEWFPDDGKFYVTGAAC